MKMSIDRLTRRLRSVGTRQAAFACAFSLLLVTSGVFVFVTTAQESPDGVDDRETFTVRTGGIYPDLLAGGQICAEKIESDVNKVTVTNSTLKDVDIYLGEEGNVESHISFPSGEVNGKLVLYTNGENPLVNTLATLGICLPPGMPNPLPTTLKAYWLGVDNLQPEDIQITSGGDAPSVSGPGLSELLTETNTSRADLGINNSSDTNNSTVNETANATPTNGTANATTPVNDTVNNTTQTNETANTTTPTNDTTNSTIQTNETANTSAPTNETANSTTPTNETTPVEAPNETTATTAETQAQSQLFSQGADARRGSPPSTSVATSQDRTDRATPEQDRTRTTTTTSETDPVRTAQPTPPPTEDDEDGILSGILGPLFD